MDSNKWQIATAIDPNYDGGINAYSASEVSLDSGDLVIRSDAAGASYLSGRVNMLSGVRYGKIEVRAKLPGTQGMWPAIWLLPKNGSWPPEIDAMELLGSDPRRVYMTAHWGNRRHPQQDQSSFTGPDFTSDYHIFSIEWDRKSVRWLIDGVEQKVITRHVPNKPMYLIMNTSVGGDWPGDPDASTSFPQEFRIDYVRIYQHPGK